MSQTTVERTSFIKSYKIDLDKPTQEFKAQIGNIEGVYISYNDSSYIKKEAYLVIQHTKRFSDITNYGVIICKEGEEISLPRGYEYVGTVSRPTGFNHIYVVNDKDRADNSAPSISIPR